MPENWKTYKLGEIAALRKKTVRPKDFNGEKYIGLEHIGQGDFLLNGIGIANDVTSNKFRFKNGDILYGKIRPYFKKVYKPQFSGICSTDILIIKSSSEKIVTQEYLYQLIKTQAFTDKAVETSSGTKMPRAAWNSLEQVEFAFPPLEEQKTIASILSALDDKIELNLQMNKTLEEMAMALYKHWFVDFGPFQDGEFVDTELGEIPKGWEVKNIHELMQVIYGAPFKSKLFNEDKKGYPLIRIRDLKLGKPQYFTEENHPKKTIIEKGDILAGMDALFTPYAWSGEIAVLNQRVVLFRPKNERISKRFIYEAVRPWLKFYEGAKVGTTVIHLSKSDIDGFKFVYPMDHNQVYDFHSQLETWHQQIINNHFEINTLTQLRDTLLPKLISGEVRVKDAEKTLSEVL